MLTSFRKDRLISAKNFALYYGYGKVKELSLFDLVIVDPKGLNGTEFTKLRQSNTIVITYLSLIEIHPTDPFFKSLNAEDFIMLDGKPLKNDSFGTYLVSLQSKKWINHLLNQIYHHFNVIESDGIFIDTIGDLDLHSLPDHLREQEILAAVNFLSVVKMLNPNHLFIQNNGLEKVAPLTAPYLDGICWENPPLTLDESQSWNELIIKRLNSLKEQYTIKIFLLLEKEIEIERLAYESSRKVAKENNYLLYQASDNYVGKLSLKKG